MTSTGWRTAFTVIMIIAGAALLTFAIYIYRRRKMLHSPSARAREMQQRFMSSYAEDPEAHVPLLISTEPIPPVPPKAGTMTHHRDMSTMGSGTHLRNASSVGDLNEWASRVRAPPSRVPVPPLSPEPTEDRAERHSFHDSHDPASTTPAATPSSRALRFPILQIQFPKIQLRSDGKKGRLPSLHIQFVRESNQVISSPAQSYGDRAHGAAPSLLPSARSSRSAQSQPFAHMSESPLPAIPNVSPISTISIAHQSPSTATQSRPTSGVNDVERDLTSPESVQTVGDYLFSRKLSTEGSMQTVSRNSSTQAGQALSDSGRIGRTYSISSSPSFSGSGSGSGSGYREGSRTNLRRATTWVPNVLASYSPWHGIVQDPGTSNSSGLDAGARASSSVERVESPSGQLRYAEGYRPMPTLTETPEYTPATIPRSLDDDGSIRSSKAATFPSPSVSPAPPAFPSLPSSPTSPTTLTIPSSPASSAPTISLDLQDDLLPLPSGLAGLLYPPPTPAEPVKPTPPHSGT